jgi:exosortase
MEKSPTPSTNTSQPRRLKLVAGAAIAFGGAIAWAYWPTLIHLVSEWERQPDYSHGFLVIPIAMIFLWLRRASCPVESLQPNLWGFALLIFAGAFRAAAGLYYMQPLDAWTIPFTVAGAILLAGGWQLLKWSLPSVIFLWFMAPIPYSAERWMSVPLQSIATKLSTMALVCLGQPAIAEGNIILIGEHPPLEVEEACSGLRIFVGIFALAFAFVLFSRWSWWQKVMVLVAALPVAILANVTRIAATGLLQQWVSGEAAHQFHDVAGLVMIPFAAMIFWFFLIYMGRLFTEVEDVSPAIRLQSH